ncbi:glycosyltransferase family 2 protein [Marinobacterium mangrovicola]|uniref:GT2 family glycosyltransferase n=1 Tax=Marinobacterium mangrovicola TaxID=1476959 RepID=A0A4R1GM38_9GAMM|nr:glycosyltransferase family 2 protein [Marinobacterium mangrovicola]TCK07259.1 GT2 family glycosyltransferase [Marinobacterium mangrovicola]
MNKLSHDTYSTDRWYLIDANLPENCTTINVWAVIHFATYERRIPLPASFKGRVFELLPRPKASHRLSIEAEYEQGPLSIESLDLQIVSGPIAWYWVGRRIFGTLPKVETAKAERMKLGWRKVLSDPFSVYRLLGSLRYHFPAPDYSEWRAHYWSCTDDVKRRLGRYLSHNRLDQAAVQVLVDARQFGERKVQDLTLKPVCNSLRESVRDQIGVRTSVHVLTEEDDYWPVGDPDGWVLFTQPGHILEPWALAWFLSEANKYPDAKLIYSDHAHLQNDEIPSDPYFKPDWSPELQRASHYVGDCVFIKASELDAVRDRLGYMPRAYELVLEVGIFSNEEQVRHIPAVLFHQAGASSKACPEQLSAHLVRHNIDSRVIRDGRDQVRVCYGLPASQPKVSIIIPTRDMLHFLQPCVNSILKKTTWPNFEVLILDNQSSCADTLAYMEALSSDLRVRVLAYDRPFNFSAINNFAVEHAEGDLVCMLNNDTEVISTDWLDEMVSRLLQPGVGAVGARLYFSDGRVQHAGDVIGPGGCANHLHGILEAGDPGYMNRSILPQELSAVTAACLLTTRKLYRELGGLDEQNLAVAFNDVDFCLRVRQAGYRVVYTPYAELYHHESVSRGKDDNPEKQARAESEVRYMRERWASVIERDPFYNPNLNYAKPDFTLGKYPRIDWPW